MAIGGLFNPHRVTMTMSRRITTMNHGQGFTANLAAAFRILAASRWGLPVSTTRVSCDGLFGLGAITGQGRWRTIRAILFAWIVTLPVAIGFSALRYTALSHVVT